MHFRRLRSGLGLVAVLAVATAGAGFAQSGNPNAPPPPPPLNSTATTAPTLSPTAAPTAISTPVPTAVPTPVPLASPSGGPRRGRRGPERPSGTPAPDATETPPPPQFSNLNGIWEIELQPLGQRLAKYEHFFITQNGSALTGYWEHDPNKTRTPITGTFDGRLVQINADTGVMTVTFSGYVESFGDMVGMQHLGDKDTAGTAFTAQHRKKEGR